MRLHEFTQLGEIAQTKLPKLTTWKQFDESPGWETFTPIAKRFRGFIVLMESERAFKEFIIVDPSLFKSPGASGLKHELPGIRKDIPRDAIVGGIDLKKIKGGPAGYSWIVEYLAFNPRYQGQGLPVRFYKWLIDNYADTGIGVIKAGKLQTPGSQRLWANLSKVLLVFAYDPRTKRTGQVEIGDDGRLESSFDIYPELAKSIREPYDVDLKLLNQQRKSGEIDTEAYHQQRYEILSKLDQELKDAERATDVEMYALSPVSKKKAR